MTNNIRELLPIGSVVLLKEGTKKAMIFGIKQTDKASGKSTLVEKKGVSLKHYLNSNK